MNSHYARWVFESTESECIFRLQSFLIAVWIKGSQLLQLLFSRDPRGRSVAPYPVVRRKKEHQRYEGRSAPSEELVQVTGHCVCCLDADR